ncbi:MAG: nucleoside monophosphate kinase [Candidatus Pacebacteria bacterium]|nr:nucleoside monophosphate kinase [Candidatus Paceibacterota bacterium]
MNKNIPIIIILGKSGSGKGTQINFLKERFGFDFIGSGELLRERKKQKDFTGKKISQVIDFGGIIHTPVVFELWMQELENMKKKEPKGIIFDGSPRKIRETYLLDEALEWFEWNSDIKVLLIDISDDEAVKRTKIRKICPACGYILLPGKDSVDMEECPECHEKLITRPEDSEEKTRKRLDWFKTEVGPVIEHYRGKNMLTAINGEQSVENVFKDILKELGDDYN